MLIKIKILLLLSVCVFCKETCEKHFRYEKICFLRDISNCDLSDYLNCPVYKTIRNYSKCPFYICEVSLNEYFKTFILFYFTLTLMTHLSNNRTCTPLPIDLQLINLV